MKILKNAYTINFFSAIIAVFVNMIIAFVDLHLMFGLYFERDSLLK